MDITLPTDCGNAPRIGIVSEFIVNWAKGDAEAVSQWLSDDAVWTVVGDGTYSGTQATEATSPPFLVERVEVISVVTHGRLASCDGYLDAGNKRLSFSHSLRFASTSKTAKIAQLRSYYIETSQS